jgi:hypothetical protein
VLAVVLAFALRDAVEEAIIGPAAYVWWVVGILWRSVPQLLFWTIAAVGVLILVLDSLLPGAQAIPSRRVPAKPSPARGPIEEVAEWMRRAPKGTYLKWRVANRLGVLAQELLAQREGREKRRPSTRLVGRDWSPPEGIADYLEAGLSGPFAQHVPPRRPWSRVAATPLDIDPGAAIAYLEKQMGEEA